MNPFNPSRKRNSPLQNTPSRVYKETAMPTTISRVRITGLRLENWAMQPELTAADIKGLQDEGRD